jgi:putative transposase
LAGDNVNGATNRSACSAEQSRLRATRTRRGKKRSVRLRLKVKYNPADLTQIHVFDPRLGDYVTLECKEEFLRGLSKKHFDTLQRWAEIQNLAFNTPEERKLARATLK